jgi:hypothetical protein
MAGLDLYKTTIGFNDPKASENMVGYDIFREVIPEDRTVGGIDGI